MAEFNQAFQFFLNGGSTCQDDVSLRNELGLRAYDLAVMAGRQDAAEFILLYQTSLKISRDLLEAADQKERTAAELAELSTHFK